MLLKPNPAQEYTSESFGGSFVALLALVVVGTTIVTHLPSTSRTLSANTLQHYQQLFANASAPTENADQILTYRDNFVGP